MDVACSLKEVWQEVREATIAILENVDFAQLAERAGGRWVAPLELLPPRADGVPSGAALPDQLEPRRWWPAASRALRSPR